MWVWGRGRRLKSVSVPRHHSGLASLATMSTTTIRWWIMLISLSTNNLARMLCEEERIQSGPHSRKQYSSITLPRGARPCLTRFQVCIHRLSTAPLPLIDSLLFPFHMYMCFNCVVYRSRSSSTNIFPTAESIIRLLLLLNNRSLRQTRNVISVAG
ncbi:hypothetical protein SISNIDRAFT_57434 [Sistotremastrum niveocremeum HHB9708]|uniref:Uncharacterized protein n=2 Tax=Sistotremastraceae TaxID=3402574 RepID=A0A164VEB0_9AGAM|nr:hypothetical protein SISNIDRAFT_57434 [Sistotremastrum niveocremeum HHB9708]KZT32031.1 hypothetical protein SISSUDRAFT_593292 [Sistotremastrum suecicum HHB10207 ss-3]